MFFSLNLWLLYKNFTLLNKSCPSDAIIKLVAHGSTVYLWSSLIHQNLIYRTEQAQIMCLCYSDGKQRGQHHRTTIKIQQLKTKIFLCQAAVTVEANSSKTRSYLHIVVCLLFLFCFYKIGHGDVLFSHP